MRLKIEDAIEDCLFLFHSISTGVNNEGNATGVNNEGANSIMQKFWDSAMALAPIYDEDKTKSESSLKFAFESGDTGKSLAYPSTNHPNSFAFKIQDKRGRMHRFICGHF